MYLNNSTRTKGCKMNSRFKFRVWDTDIKEYLVGEFLVGGCGDMIHNVVDYESFLNKGNYIIEQCTGLKDKNGNLIYEGDLLGGLPVVWVNELNGFRVKVNTIHGWDWHYINEFTNREITGNIHEQAEQKE